MQGATFVKWLPETMADSSGSPAVSVIVPRVVRAQAEAQAALVGEAAREGRELGRWEGRWETRWEARDVRAAGGFLAWLRSLLD